MSTTSPLRHAIHELYGHSRPARCALLVQPRSWSHYLQNYNMEGIDRLVLQAAGDSYEAPVYTAKQAYVAAINTMQTNHPNDWVTVVPYSWPGDWQATRLSSSYGRFNCVSSPLGPNYAYATPRSCSPSRRSSRWYSNKTEITPYDADPCHGPDALGQSRRYAATDGDTCFAMALMLCYNQFALTPSTDTTLRSYVTSTPITFPTGMAGGLGRKGAQKVIIFETDGLPNCTATASGWLQRPHLHGSGSIVQLFPDPV